MENKQGLLNTTQADPDGIFEAAILKQPANTILKITVDNEDGSTYAIEITVAATGWVLAGGLWYYYGGWRKADRLDYR